MSKDNQERRILVVDDDPAIRELVKAVLEAEGFKVTLANDGQEGINALDSEPRPVNYCMVVLDMMMPGMHGLDVLTRMKLHAHTSSIPVLMLTAERQPEDIMSGYSTGADYYITKPFTRQQLLFGIQLILGGGKAE